MKGAEFITTRFLLLSADSSSSFFDSSLQYISALDAITCNNSKITNYSGDVPYETA